MDLEKKIYPKDVWNWIKKIFKPLKKHKFYPNSQKEEKVYFDVREQQYFSTAMETLDDAMSNLDRAIDNIDRWDTGIGDRDWPRE